MKINGFRDLKVWHSGKELALAIYQLTATFPKEEQYGITSQMRRASISIPANIAEGYNRYHSKDYKRFLYIALGSCAEPDTLLEIAGDLEYINDNQQVNLQERIDHESRMLKSLVNKLG